MLRKLYASKKYIADQIKNSDNAQNSSEKPKNSTKSTRWIKVMFIFVAIGAIIVCVIRNNKSEPDNIDQSTSKSMVNENDEDYSQNSRSKISRSDLNYNHNRRGSTFLDDDNAQRWRYSVGYNNLEDNNYNNNLYKDYNKIPYTYLHPSQNNPTQPQYLDKEEADLNRELMEQSDAGDSDSSSFSYSRNHNNTREIQNKDDDIKNQLEEIFEQRFSEANNVAQNHYKLHDSLLQSLEEDDKQACINVHIYLYIITNFINNWSGASLMSLSIVKDLFNKLKNNDLLTTYLTSFLSELYKNLYQIAKKISQNSDTDKQQFKNYFNTTQFKNYNNQDTIYEIDLYWNLLTPTTIEE